MKGEGGLAKSAGGAGSAGEAVCNHRGARGAGGGRRQELVRGTAGAGSPISSMVAEGAK